MRIIKVIYNLIKGPGHTEDSTVKFNIELDEEYRTKLFNDAVKEVVKKKLHDKILDQLCEMCYTEEEVIETKKAIKYYNENKDADNIAAKFPKAIFIVSYGIVVTRTPGIVFNMDKFIDNIIEDSGILEEYFESDSSRK
jgi:hypothetical protein